MREILDASRFALPADVLINAFELEIAIGSRSQLFLQMRERIDKSREAQKEWVEGFDRLYEEALKDVYSVPFLVRWAAALLDKQRAALEQFHPLIEMLQQGIVALGPRPDPEALELYQAVFDLAFSWITPYQRLCGKLLELASDRRSDSHKILRARPVGGEVDYSELSREHIAKYPKIRAALAE